MWDVLLAFDVCQRTWIEGGFGVRPTAQSSNKVENQRVRHGTQWPLSKRGIPLACYL